MPGAAVRGPRCQVLQPRYRHSNAADHPRRTVAPRTPHEMRPHGVLQLVAGLWPEQQRLEFPEIDCTLGHSMSDGVALYREWARTGDQEFECSVRRAQRVIAEARRGRAVLQIDGHGVSPWGRAGLVDPGLNHRMGRPRGTKGKGVDISDRRSCFYQLAEQGKRAGSELVRKDPAKLPEPAFRS